jgi:hypothetical protein
MYFEFTGKYKRDVYFCFDETKNDNMDIHSFNNGQKADISLPLIFSVDKIDSYINHYDLLPTFGSTILVSKRFKNVFEDLNNDVQYLVAKIIDKKKNENNNFYLMNVLNVLHVMDKDRSIYEYKKYGDANILNIKKLYIKDNSLNGHSIIRMAEHKSYVIVTEEFKNRCIKEKLKGIVFLEEGHSM